MGSIEKILSYENIGIADKTIMVLSNLSITASISFYMLGVSKPQIFLVLAAILILQLMAALKIRKAHENNAYIAFSFVNLLIAAVLII